MAKLREDVVQSGTLSLTDQAIFKWNYRFCFDSPPARRGDTLIVWPKLAVCFPDQRKPWDQLFVAQLSATTHVSVPVEDLLWKSWRYIPKQLGCNRINSALFNKLSHVHLAVSLSLKTIGTCSQSSNFAFVSRAELKLGTLRLLEIII